MSDSDAIRADIERTRGELGEDVDTLAEKVRPSSIAHRQTDRIKSGLGSVKESVMGSASDAKDAATKVTGNAVAVGLVAFGLGLLVSSLIPASEKEKDLAAVVKDKSEPLVSAAGDAVKETADHLKEPAMDAAHEVGDRVTDAAASVKEQAQSSGDDVAAAADSEGARV